MSLCVYVCACVGCVYVNVHACMCAYVLACVCVCPCVHMCVHVLACVFVDVYMCVCLSFILCVLSIIIQSRGRNSVLTMHGHNVQALLILIGH